MAFDYVKTMHHAVRYNHIKLNEAGAIYLLHIETCIFAVEKLIWSERAALLGRLNSLPLFKRAQRHAHQHLKHTVNHKYWSHSLQLKCQATIRLFISLSRNINSKLERSFITFTNGCPIPIQWSFFVGPWFNYAANDELAENMIEMRRIIGTTNKTVYASRFNLSRWAKIFSPWQASVWQERKKRIFPFLTCEIINLELAVVVKCWARPTCVSRGHPLLFYSNLHAVHFCWHLRSNAIVNGWLA